MWASPPTKGRKGCGGETAGGAMHPKGTCSASLHCVGIAPYEGLQGVRRGKVKENKKILERLDVCVQPFLFFCPGAGPKRKGDM